MDYDDHVFKEAENRSTEFDLYEDNPYVAQEVTLTILGLVGVTINILLIYIVCYFRKLHTNTNIYIVNWAIADIGTVVITISCFRICAPIFNLPDVLLCFYFGLACALLFNVMFFMLLLAIDWGLSAFLPRPLEKFREYTKTIIATSWTFSAIYSLASTAMCSLAAYYMLFHYSIPLVYCVLLILIIGLHSVRLIRKWKGKFEYQSVSLLYIPTAFTLCWTMSWINIWFLDIPPDYYIITEIPLFLHPIINFAILVFTDDDFKVCFYIVIKGIRCPLKRAKDETFEECNNVTSQAPIVNMENRHI